MLWNSLSPQRTESKVDLCPLVPAVASRVQSNCFLLMLIDPIEKVDGQRNRSVWGVDVPDSSPSEALQSSTLNPLHDYPLPPLTVAHHFFSTSIGSPRSLTAAGTQLFSQKHTYTASTRV